MAMSKLIPIIIGNSILSIYFKSRQYRKISSPLPENAKALTTEEEYKKIISYNKSVLLYSMFVIIIDLLKDIFIIQSLRKVFDLYFSNCSNADTWIIVAFTAFSSITEIPFNLIYDFVIEQMHGFNNKTLGIFFKDTFISFLVTMALTYPISAISIILIKRFSNFYIHVWIFLTITIFILNIAYPSFIAPLYNKFEPLRNEELKKKVDELANKIGFKLSKILVMDGSKKSKKSNAYFTGFGKSKQIVFYDTILEQLDQEETLAVLSHEFGHWACNHNYYLMCMSSIIIFIYEYLLQKMMICCSKNTPVGIIIIEFMFYYSSLNLPITLIQNAIIRCFERQADKFAVTLGYGEKLKSALIKLQKENKVSLVNDNLYSVLSFNHPPVLERLEFIDAEMKADEKKLN